MLCSQESVFLQTYNGLKIYVSDSIGAITVDNGDEIYFVVSISHKYISSAGSGTIPYNKILKIEKVQCNNN